MNLQRELLLALVLAPAIASTDTVAEKCEKEWPGDYRMQEHCMQQQFEGWNEFYAFVDRYKLDKTNVDREYRAGNPAAQILSKCVSDWPEDGHMAAYCVTSGEAAAKRLGKLPLESQPAVSTDLDHIETQAEYFETHGLEPKTVMELGRQGDNPAAVKYVKCSDEAAAAGTSIAGLAECLTAD